MSYPEKLRKDNFSVNKEVLYGYNDYMILNEIIDNELFNLFKGNVKEQLLYIIELSSNIKCENIKNKRNNKDVVDIISKCSDISIYRNCLIHNSGFTTKDFSDRVSIYKHEINQRIDFNERLITQFINDYLLFFDFLEEKILKNIDYIKGTEIDKLRNLWNQCFNSNLLIFDEYWVVDEERDLIIDIKYPEYESSISSSEKVYLSIWRHQFYDGIPTEEFLICSINEDIIYTIYKGLDEIKFYHMYQQAHG